MLNRIAKYIDYKGISVRAFESAIGASDGMIRRAIKNNTDIQGKWLKNIADIYHDINLVWLITGEGEMLKNDFSAEDKKNEHQDKKKCHDTQNNFNEKNVTPFEYFITQKNVTPLEENVTPICNPNSEIETFSIASTESEPYNTTSPAYSCTQDNIQNSIPLIPVDAVAGFAAGNSVQVMEYECERYVVPAFSAADFLIRVTGNSMYPKYYSGDMIACKKIALGAFFQWNKVYVIDSEQGVLVKRVKKSQDKGKILLVSENIDYEPFEIPLDEINSLAIVCGVIRLE